MSAHPNNTVPPIGVAATRSLHPMLQPTITTVHMAEVGPTLTSHIPQTTDISTYTLPEEAWSGCLMFLDNDYDETVDQLWDCWYKDGINLIVQNKHVSEKLRTEWSEKDKKIFLRIKFIVNFIEAHSKEKPVGVMIGELEKNKGRRI
jgi:hypothetical protein